MITVKLEKKPNRFRKNKKWFRYSEAVEYLGSKGICCDPCQDEEGEWVNDLLDELYDDPFDEDEKQERICLDDIANMVLTARSSCVGKEYEVEE